MENVQIVDRYDGNYPDPETMCKGQCEGLGWVPVHKNYPNDEEGPWHDLWEEAEIINPSEDGWHFVTCPTCGGTGKRKSEDKP
jgi:hypothetical protein